MPSGSPRLRVRGSDQRRDATVERGPFAGVSYQSTEEQVSMAIASINPATGEVVKNYESLTGTQIEQKLQVAVSAFAKHRRTPFTERASKMMRAAEILEKEKDECAYLMTLEMGKPLAQARAEAAKCATACRYYAERAGRMLSVVGVR